MQGLQAFMQQQQAPMAAAQGSAPAAAARSSSRSAPAAVAVQLPAWCAQVFTAWWQASLADGASVAAASPAASAAGPVSLSGAELGALCGHLGKGLQVGVVWEAAKISNDTLFLKTGAAG